MKIGIIHLSDFHVSENFNVYSPKIDKLVDALNVLNHIDKFIIAFSGDLAATGKQEEYKNARILIARIVKGIKAKQGQSFIELLAVPGNHDLNFPNNSRLGKDIQNYYNNNTIDSYAQNELNMLDNFFSKTDFGTKGFINTKIIPCNNYKIQFNLINTAPFSTLLPDSKELHYFPKKDLNKIEKPTDVNICITIMHHSYEWFHPNYKKDLKQAIINNSEMLFTGHEHCEETQSISLNSSASTYISAAGQMNFSSLEGNDSFNVMVIDTETNILNGFVFTWDTSSKLYAHLQQIVDTPLQLHSSKLMPLPKYLEKLKEDPYNTFEAFNDFTKYFVFPKLVTNYKSNPKKHEEIKKFDDFIKVLNNRKHLIVSGAESSGKTTLLKYLFISLTQTKVPLFFSIENNSSINPN